MTILSTRDIAAAVRGRRQELEMSQDKLATLAGVSRKWVYDFEAGKPTVEFTLVLRVLDAVGLALALTESPKTSAGHGDFVDLDALLDDHRP